eukprot:7257558-Pyramimonas_sp.AAC.1
MAVIRLLYYSPNSPVVKWRLKGFKDDSHLRGFSSVRKHFGRASNSPVVGWWLSKGLTCASARRI